MKKLPRVLIVEDEPAIAELIAVNLPAIMTMASTDLNAALGLAGSAVARAMLAMAGGTEIRGVLPGTMTPALMMVMAIANGIIAGFPGTDQNPDAVVAATGAVFWAVLIASGLAVIAALAIPKTPVPRGEPATGEIATTAGG